MRDIEDVADALPRMLEKAGLEPDGWDVRILSQRDDAVMRRVVLGLEAPGQPPLVLKAVFHPYDPDAFCDGLNAQDRVAISVPGVPRILTADLSSQLVLMERLPGQTLFDLCVDQPVDTHAPHLRAVGAWLDVYHRAEGVEPRNFRPEFTQRYLDEVAEAVASGKKQIPQRPRFLEAVNWLRANPPRGAQCRTVAAQCHGDLNMRNLMVDGDRVGALDFQPLRVVPVGHDLVRLFLHYAAFCPQAYEGDSILPGVDLSAFFEGYTLTGPWDFTLPYLARVRLLDDWSRIPKLQEDRSFAEQRRFRGILGLVDRAFG